MAVELRTLRVSADLDASGYARGAGQISAAQELMSRGHRMVGLAAGESEQKVRSSLDPIEKLSRQFVTGYGEAAKFEQALRSLNRQVEAGRVDAALAEAIYSGMVQKFGSIANGADLAAQGYRQLGAAVDTANAKMAATPVRPLHNVLSPANDNEGRSRRQGLMYQGFDVGTTVAGGMNLGLIAAQQGPQIIQMYAGNGGVNALLKDTAVLAGGAARAMGPIAIAAGIGALAIGSLRDELESATGESVTFMETFSGAMKVIGSDINSVIGPTLDTIGTNVSYALDKLGSAAVDIAELVINSFRAAYEDIKLLWNQFPNVIGAAVVGAANTVIQTITDMIMRATAAMDAMSSKANEWLPESMQIGTFGDLGLSKALIPNTYLDDLKKGIADRNKAIADIMSDTPIRDYKNSVRDRVAGDIRDEAAAPDISIVPIPTRRPSTLDIADPKETKAEKDADRLKESYDRMIRSGNDRIEQIRAEAAMLGKSGVEVDAYRFQLELLQRVEQRGTAATPAQRAEIEKLGQAYKVAATEAANLKLAADLKFETEQEYRNRTDQDIASRQRGAGLAVDMTTEYANSIRELERIKQARSDLGGFFTDLRDGLMNGDSIGEAFGNAFLNGLMKITTRISDSLIDSLVSSILGQPSTGGSSGDGILGSIASAGMSAANDNTAYAAPVMAVTRSALPTTDIASYITEAATKRGIDAGIALRVAQSEGGLNSWNLQSGFVKNGVREASYGPFQLYKGGGLGNEFQRATGMDPALASSGPAGVDFALDHAKKNGWGAWYGAKRVGIDKWEGIGQGANTSNDTAAAAVERMAANSNQAATNLGGLTSATSTAMQGVGDFGTGLGQFSQQLMSAASGANSPSSLPGSLGSLLGGISPTSSLWAPNTTLGSFLLTGKAGGGYTGPGGINEPAGITHKGEIVWSQMDIARSGGVHAVEGMRLGWPGYAGGGLVGGPASAPQRRSTIQDAANDSGPSGRKAGDTGSITIRGGNVIVQGDVSEKNLQAIQDAIEENNRFLPDRIEEHRRNPRKRMAG